MTLSLNRSKMLLFGVVIGLVVIVVTVYGAMRSQVLEHPATLAALEVVLESEPLQKTIGEPVTIGAWVEGEGFLRSEDLVSARLTLRGPQAEVVMVMNAKLDASGNWEFQVLRIESPEGAEIADLVDAIGVQKLMVEKGALLAQLGDGRSLAGKGSYLEAIEIYADVLAEHPENAEATRLWGIAAYRLEDYETAEEKLKMALAMMVSDETDGDYAMDTGEEPSWGIIIENWAMDGEVGPLDRWLEAAETLGLIYLDTERSRRCVETFTTVIMSGEASASPRIPKAWYQRARCYLQQDMVDHAQVGARTACAKDSNLVEACKMAGLPTSR